MDFEILRLVDFTLGLFVLLTIILKFDVFLTMSLEVMNLLIIIMRKRREHNCSVKLTGAAPQQLKPLDFTGITES